MPFLAANLRFSHRDLAQLVFLYSAMYAVGQFISGTLADRMGPKKLVAAGMLLSALCSASMAIAAGMPGVFGILAALQIVNGLSQACGWPGVLKLTGAWFDSAHRGVLMGWWSTCLVVGGFAGTTVATWFATSGFQSGWKMGATGPAGVLVGTCVVFFALTVERPRQTSTKESRAVATSSAWGEVLRSEALRSIVGGYFCLKLMRYTFQFWLPLYMVEKLKYGPGEAGYSSSAYELVGFLGVPLAGYLSDKAFKGARFPVAAAMMFALSVVCMFFPWMSSLGRIGNLVAIGLAGILTFGPDTLTAGPATQDAVSHGSTATAGGFVNGVGSIGQLLSPVLVDYTVARFGWDGLFGVFVVVAALGGVSLSLMVRPESRAIKLRHAG